MMTTTVFGPSRRTGAPEVGVATVRRPTHTLLRLDGEIDIATAPELRTRLLKALRPGTPLAVIDMGGVSFCGAAGIAVLVDVRHRAIVLGLPLRLTGLRPQVARILHLTGLDQGFEIHPTLRAALTGGTELRRRGARRMRAGHITGVA
ncbi:STAS domain-containing protein [Nocardiopsis sediminis]|uniref:Anti-sigma factor antagonist n=1 Tax=Nocardiopsis sediminis TaxID=1778267 RepID=A0ABV8FKC1_9ACTN